MGPDGIVAKRVFEAGAYRTRAGATIPGVRVGYQTAGRLNAAGDNAVLITHFFSGSGHAFGRHAADGPAGFWDVLVGPGRPIDTGRFFVVASDTLVNLNVHDGLTVTTGPATPNPATGRPWGMDFPVVSIRDFVEVQKRLLDSLGVRRLALVAGPSMGAMQAVEWAAAYPDLVDRVMAAIGGAAFDPWMLAWLDIWASPIRLDPDWRGGAYDSGRPPLRGLTEAMKIVTVQAQDRGALAVLGRGPVEGQDPAAEARARLSDANHFIWLARANQLFLHEYASTEAALAPSRARWLVVPSTTDRVWLPEYSHDLVTLLRRLGRPVELAELTGPHGHLNGIVPASIGAIAPRLAAFLA
jgi:homoserine O-acetyltransferase/O-succinyltransferase